DVEFGDVNTQQLPLTAMSQQGRGFLISSIPYDRATRHDRTTLQGDLQPGWDVELYRNDELLSFQRASNNGRYEFTDVPLLSGLNVLRLVFYGPFGQTREEVHRFFVSDELTPQGKSYMGFSLTQQDTSSFDILTQNQNAATLSGVTPLQSEVARGKPRAIAQYEYGVLDNVSLFANAVSLTTPDDVSRHYASAGLATALAGVYGRADVAHETAGDGNAVELSLQDNLYGVSLSGDYQRFSDFISDYTESVTDPVTSRSSIRADTPLALPYLPHFNNGVVASHVTYESGRNVNDVSYRLATAIQRVAVSNNLMYITDSAPTNSSLSALIGEPVTSTPLARQVTGDFIMSFPVRQLMLRGDVIYGLSPDKNIQTLLMSGQYNFSQRTNAILEVDRQLINERLTTYTLTLNQKFDKFLLGANVSHADNGTNALGFTVSLSFGEDPRSGAFKVFPDPTAGSGVIAARAAQDLGDDGSAPVENAKFYVNRGGTDAATDSDGDVLLRNIPPDVHTSVVLDGKTLENPYLQSANPGVDVVTRPGVAALVDFPIIGSGDVEGTVSILQGDNTLKGAANVSVELVGPDGKVVKEARTSFDGYYLIAAVPVGRYTLRISPEQAQRLGFGAEPDKMVEIKNREDSSHVIDMTIAL
ncbi:MAG: carboxypeptidase regulatory-like domain-containing protein, partial [Pseudomonadota bacterium]|nr:carboxypeptidase regulatory-like domain-containing protein [Pseudomonadota bacterium]